MSGSFRRVWTVAATECRAALRNRRAVVSTLLFVAVAGLVMYGTVSAFAAMERELLAALKLPPAEGAGSVTLALWKSPVFTRIMGHLSGGSLVFADIRGRHPILLAYAFFIFQVTPLLTLVTSASRVADDVRCGAARYWLVRTTRTEWSIGKFFGEALMLAVAMLVGALAAWGVATWRLAGNDWFGLLPGILDWTARAWVYAFAWLGLFCGMSHIAKTGGKATALAILATMGAVAWPVMLENLASVGPAFAGVTHLDALVPSGAMPLLWRRSVVAVFQGTVHLAALAFLYLAVGSAVFRRRDV